MSHKPTLLLDLDGPVVDFDKAFYALCKENDWPMHSTLETQCHFYSDMCIIDKTHKQLAKDIVYNTPWFRYLPPADGAIEGVDNLTKYFDVWLCTKPLEPNVTCRDDKAQWVIEHLGKSWEKRLIITPDKSMVCGDILLDDRIKLKWLDTAQWNPVVFTKPWNSKHSKWEHLPHWDWSQPLELLLEI